jgi:hypothetical protein
MGSFFQGKTKVTQAVDPLQQQGLDAYMNALNPISSYLGGQVDNFMRQPTYTGQTYADLDPLQQQYYNQAGNFAGNQMGSANALGAGAMNNYNATADYGTRISAFGDLLKNPNGGFNMGAALANSPMAQNIIDASSRDITRNLGSNLAQLDRTAVGGGNTNSIRAGMMEGTMAGLAGDRIADVGAQVRQDMFNQGVGQYNNNIGQQANALGMLQGANSSAAGNMLNGFNLGNSALGTMSGAGNFMNQYNQGAMDDAAKQFYLAQDRPLELANNYMSLFNPLASFDGGAGYSGAQTGPSGASMMGDAFNMIGTGMTLFCWVAREVYGQHNHSWLIFRHWMFAHSPRWFFKLYATYGASFAQFIADKPKAKRLVKHFMDRVVRKYGGVHGSL